MIRHFILLLSIFVFSLQAADVKLIWQSNTRWESDWIDEIFEECDVEVIHDGNFNVMCDRSIIVISHVKNPHYEEYFKKLRQKGYRFGVVHLSDEQYSAPTGFYEDALFVFRNYWHSKFDQFHHVVNFPLGYKEGFWSDGIRGAPKASERKYVWSFAGQVKKKPTRQKMIQQLKKVPNYYIHETKKWADPKQLSATEYRDLLLDTVFCPCPMGWCNLDSFRTFEALECGCIPIVERGDDDYFSHYLGDYPFLSVYSWEDAPKLMQSYLKDPNRLEQKRKECRAWWLQYKASLKEVARQWVDLLTQNP